MPNVLLSDTPPVTVEIKFDGTNWTDVSNYCRGFSVKRGRNHELSEIEAGTANVILANRGRQFEPEYASSPYYPNVLPLRQIRISAGANLIGNPSFETDLSGWSIFNFGGAGTPAQTRDTTQFAQGIASNKVTNTAGSGDQGTHRTVSGLTPGATYTVSLYYNVTSFTSGASGNLGLWVLDGVTNTGPSTNITGTTSGWERHSVTITLSGSTTSIDVRLYAPFGTVYYDAIQVETGSQATQYVDAPYRLFTGTIDEWPQETNGPQDAQVVLQCSDGFELLNNIELTATVAGGGFSGAAISSLLTQAGYTGATAIDTGLVAIQALSSDRVSCLSTIQDVAKTELGYFFFSANGTATFHDQNHRRLLSSAATFEDTQTADNPYVDMTFTYSKNEIRNNVMIQRNTGTTQTVTDTPSVTSFGTRSFSLNTLHNVDVDAGTMASQIRAAYAQPHLRVTSLTLRPRMAPVALWPKALGYDIGTRITVNRTPTGSGTPVTGEYFIEGVSHSYSQPNRGGEAKWLTTWNLGAVALYSTGWILGVDQLGVSTIPI